MPPDAVAVAPHMYKVVLENDRVRVLEARGKPGDTAEMHSHPAGVALTLANGQIRITLPGGQTVDTELKPNEVRYREPREHAGELIAGELHMVLIELK